MSRVEELREYVFHTMVQWPREGDGSLVELVALLESDLASAKLAMQHAVDALAEVEKERDEMRGRLEKAERVVEAARAALIDADDDDMALSHATRRELRDALSVYSKET